MTKGFIFTFSTNKLSSLLSLARPVKVLVSFSLGVLLIISANLNKSSLLASERKPLFPLRPK